MLRKAMLVLQALMDAEMEEEGGVSPRVSPFADVRDIGALLQRAHLWTLTNAAEDHDMLERQVTTVTRKTLANLRSEFARR